MISNWYNVSGGGGDHVLRSAYDDRYIILNIPEVSLSEYYGM